MRLLLDTHVFVWWAAADRRLREEARAAIAAPEATVAVSAASAWEIAIKRTTGKLRAPNDVEAQIARHRFSPLPITIAHALRAGDLPLHHADPFDRMLVAQAQAEGMTIVTRDPKIARYDVSTLAA